MVAMVLAQAPCEASWPTLALVVAGPGLPAALEAPLRAEATYEASQAGLCVTERAQVAAIARIDWPERGPLTLSISSAAVAGQSIRQLSRVVALEGVPADGVALTIGATLGELLREARRELPALAPAREAVPTWGLGAAVAGEVFGGGQRHGGADVFGRLRLGERVWLEPAVQVRVGLEAQSSSGSVRALLVGGALHALVELVRAGPFVASAVGGARVAWLRFEGRPSELASGVVAETWVSSLRGGVDVGLSVAALRVSARVTVGAPLRAAAALDGAARVTGTTGVEGGAAVAVGGAF